MTAPRAGRLGRRPNSGKPRVSLTADLVPATYSPPATLDRYSAVPADSWGMDGNGPDPTNPPNVPDGAGDCTCADVDHQIKSIQVAAGNTEVVSTAAEVLDAYSEITGYNPADPNTDQGAEMQAVRSFWQKTGFILGGQRHKILLFAELAVSNTNLIRWALDQFGAVGLGINFPASAMDQFNAGKPWDVVPGAQIEGGHAVALVGYDTSFWYVLTWGQVQKVTPAFFAKYVEEVWTALDEEFVNDHSGTDPLGGTLYALGQQFAAVTGKPNPVSPPSPGPAPTPTPAPVPAPSDVHLDSADEALMTQLTGWLGEHHVGVNRAAVHHVKDWINLKTTGGR